MGTYPQLTVELLEKLIADLFDKDEALRNDLTLYTGRGGVKDYIRKQCETLELEYNWRNFRRIYTWNRKMGFIKIYHGANRISNRGT